MKSELLAELRSGGAVVAQGQFGLDEGKAREKMQRFQLPDPQRYVLELVQAAVLLGATRVDFKIDSDEMLMTFDGDHLERKDIERLFQAPFSDDTTHTTKVLRHLAIGLNAAQALNCHIMHLESGNENGSTLLRWSQGKETIEWEEHPWQTAVFPVDRVGNKTGGTRIYIQQTMRLEHLFIWVRSLSEQFPEVAYLYKHCGRTPLKINVNTVDIGRNWKFGMPGMHRIDTEHEKGSLKLIQDPQRRVELHQNYVLVSEHTGWSSPFGYEAFVNSSRLKKDLSQSAFISDEAYDLVLNKQLHHEFNRALRHKYRHLSGRFLSDPDRDDAYLLLQGMGVNFEEELPADDETWKFMRQLAEAAIWPVAHVNDEETQWYGGSRVVSADKFAGQGPIRFARRIYKDAEYPHPVLFLSDDLSLSTSRHVSFVLAGVEKIGPISLKTFQTLFQTELLDVTEEMQTAETRSRNRARFEQSMWSQDAIRRSGQYELAFAVDRFNVTLVLRQPDETYSEVYWVRDGKLLSSEFLDDDFLRGLSMVIEGPIEPNVRWDGPKRDGLMDKLAEQICNQLPVLIDQCVSSEHVALYTQTVSDYLYRLAYGSLHLSVYNALKSGKADHYRAHLGPRSPYSTAPNPVDRLGKVADLKFMNSVNAGLLSLKDIQELLKSEGFIRAWDQTSFREAQHHPEYKKLNGTILIVDPPMQFALQAAFPDQVRTDIDELRLAAAHRRYLKKPEWQFGLPRAGYVHIGKFDGEDRLIVGLLDQPHVGAVVTVLYHGRVLDRFHAPTDWGYFDAMIETTDLTPTADFDGVLHDAKWFDVCDRVKSAAETVMRGFLKEHAALPLSQRKDLFWSGILYLAHQQDFDIWEMKCFEDELGQPMTLREVQGAVVHKQLYVVQVGANVLENLVHGDTRVIRVTPAMPMDAFVDAEVVDVSRDISTIERLDKARYAFLQRPEELMLVEPSPSRSIVSVFEGAIAGEVAYDAAESTEEGTLVVQLYHQHRYVETRVFRVPKGYFFGKLDVGTAIMSADLSRILELPEGFEALARDAADRALQQFTAQQTTNSRTPAMPAMQKDLPPDAAVLRRAVRVLHEVRGNAHYLVSDASLSSIRLSEPVEENRLCVCRKMTYYVNKRHGLFVAASSGGAAMAALVSAIYSEINRVEEVVTDDHEAEFQSRLSAWFVQQNRTDSF